MIRALFLSFLLLTCCQKEEPHPNSLQLPLSSEPSTLSPRGVRTIKEILIACHLFEGLTRMGETGTPELALAEKITIDKSKTLYTISIKKSIWSNGAPVTTDSFVKGWKRALDPSVASPMAHLLFPIQNARMIYQEKLSPNELGVEILDTYTLQVQLEHPTPFFIELLAYPVYFPAYSDQFEEDRISNGPFLLKEWKPYDHVVLIKNPSYHDADSVHLKEISWVQIHDPETEFALFEQEKLHWAGMPSSSPLMHGELPGNLHPDTYEVTGTCWIEFNTQKFPFNSKHFRLALAHAVDTESLASDLLNHLVQTPQGLCPKKSALEKAPSFNPKKAKQHFDAFLAEYALLQEELPQLCFNFTQKRRSRQIAQVIAQQLYDVLGLDVQLQELEWGVFVQKSASGDFGLSLKDWIADFQDPFALLELFIQDRKTNTARWANPQFDELLADSLVEADREKRREVLRQAELLLLQECPLVPLYHHSFTYLKTPKLQGVTFSPFGGVDYKSATLS